MPTASALPASGPADSRRPTPAGGRRLRPLLLLGLGALELPRCCAAKDPRFSNVFQSSMVLQRNKPIEVWGYDASYGETLDVMLDFQQGGEVSWTEAIAGKDGTWRATLSAPPPDVVGKQLLLALSRRGAEEPSQVLDDVVLGDVYLFSGQSNVDLPVSYVHQFSPEDEKVEESFADQVGQSGSLRLMIVPARCGLMYQDSNLATELEMVEECVSCPSPFSRRKASLDSLNSCNLLGGHSGNFTYCNCDSLRWTRPTGAKVRGFSAVAWFMGKALLATQAATGVPIGLVRSSWGATNIAVWSGVDALSKCPQEGQVPTSFAPYVKSALWAHMIHPLRGLQLSAVVWVHGARNIGGITPYMGGTYYSCALRAMISDWREKLDQADLPFLVVESPVYCNELDYRTWHTWCDDRDSQLKFPDEHLPEMRMAQNEAETLSDVYLVSVMDQGSLEKVMGGAIHSERKPELGHRLALAARAAVYRDTTAVWSGPKATFAWQSDPNEISVCFDTRGGGKLMLNESAICPSVVNPVYCPGATFELLSKGAWSLPTSISITGSSVALKIGPEVGPVERVRYAWADWPVCSIVSEAGMPARLFNLPVHSEEAGDEPFCPQDGSGTASPPGSKGKVKAPRTEVLTATSSRAAGAGKADEGKADAEKGDEGEADAEKGDAGKAASDAELVAKAKKAASAPSLHAGGAAEVVVVKPKKVAPVPARGAEAEEAADSGSGGAGAMMVIAILGSVLLSLPVLALAAVTALWGFPSWLEDDRRWVVKQIERLLGRTATERTPDVPDCAVLPSSRTSSQNSAVPLTMKMQTVATPVVSPTSSRDRSARGPLARQQQAPPRGRPSPRTNSRSLVQDEHRLLESPRSTSPPRGAGSRRLQASPAEEVPLIKQPSQKEPEPTKHTKHVFRVFGRRGSK